MRKGLAALGASAFPPAVATAVSNPTKVARMKTSWSMSVALAMALAGSLLMASSAQARGRGMSPAQKKAIQEKLQQQQQLQQNMEKAKAKKDQEVMDRFDTNKNGKIDPSEKTGYDKFWRDVRLGKTPHPYDTIKPSDVNPQPAAAKK